MSIRLQFVRLDGGTGGTRIFSSYVFSPRSIGLMSVSATTILSCRISFFGFLTRKVTF